MAQSSEHCSICWLQGWTRHLSAQDSDLVTEHDDLHRQVLSLATRKTDQLNRAYEGNVEEGECHTPSSSTKSCRRKSRSMLRMTFSAPTGHDELAPGQPSGIAACHAPERHERTNPGCSLSGLEYVLRYCQLDPGALGVLGHRHFPSDDSPKDPSPKDLRPLALLMLGQRIGTECLLSKCSSTFRRAEARTD